MAASWCRAVCAVMSCRFRRFPRSMSIYIYIHLSTRSSLLQINFCNLPRLPFSFRQSLSLISASLVSTRLVRTAEAVNEPTENLTFTPTSHSYALGRNNECKKGRRGRGKQPSPGKLGGKHIAPLRGALRDSLNWHGRLTLNYSE